jgi:hypothetical protein
LEYLLPFYGILPKLSTGYQILLGRSIKNMVAMGGLGIDRLLKRIIFAIGLLALMIAGGACNSTGDSAEDSDTFKNPVGGRVTNGEVRVDSKTQQQTENMPKMDTGPVNNEVGPITKGVGDLPPGLSDLPFLQAGWSKKHDGAGQGSFEEVKRNKRRGVETDDLDLLPKVKALQEREDLSREKILPPENMSGMVEFEFFDTASSRYFRYKVDRAELAIASRSVSEFPDENRVRGKSPDKKDIEREDSRAKSWSNATDNRTRRAIADGYSDTNTIYQSFADYGGCSATVLSANSSRMVAITAAHCIFPGADAFSSSKLRPRRNGSTSPTWGSWTVYGFGYYPVYLDNDCDDDWGGGGSCIKHDIALVLATPDSGATPPRSLGWGSRPKSFLNDHSKYRRGYPGCSFGHSPAGCTVNNLYGDGKLSVGGFSSLDSDSWNRIVKFSSDVNPGDSGSGLYYYRSGDPYVFAVTSSEPSSCKTSCTSSRPNSSRRITPNFFDFINTVIH